jgi:hypothetical protein
MIFSFVRWLSELNEILTSLVPCRCACTRLGMAGWCPRTTGNKTMGITFPLHPAFPPPPSFCLPSPLFPSAFPPSLCLSSFPPSPLPLPHYIPHYSPPYMTWLIQYLPGIDECLCRHVVPGTWVSGVMRGFMSTSFGHSKVCHLCSAAFTNQQDIVARLNLPL